MPDPQLAAGGGHDLPRFRVGVDEMDDWNAHWTGAILPRQTRRSAGVRAPPRKPVSPLTNAHGHGYFSVAMFGVNIAIEHGPAQRSRERVPRSRARAHGPVSVRDGHP